MPSQKKVLVVEDDADLADFIERTLKSQNYEVATAWSGEKALVEAQKLPDLILLDINIEGIHGLEVLAALRNDPETKGIPVVICSSADGDENKAKANTLGAADFITKPFHLDHFIQIVNRILGQPV